MEIATIVLEYLKVLLSGPVVGGIVALVFLSMFRTQIRDLIGRIARIRFPGEPEPAAEALPVSWRGDPMRNQPISEALFQQLCSRCGVLCTPVPRGALPTPDFEIHLDSTRVVCEVKQIDPNKEDLEDIEMLRSGQAVTRYVPSRLRQKLKSVSVQLKAAASSGCPTLLVVYDNTPFKLYSDHSDVVQAMFGRRTAVVGPPRTGEAAPIVLAPFFGDDRGLTPSQNTSVSALAILDGGPTSASGLRVYHNPYASVILRPELLAVLPAAQPLLPDDTTVNL